MHNSCFRLFSLWTRWQHQPPQPSLGQQLPEAPSPFCTLWTCSMCSTPFLRCGDQHYTHCKRRGRMRIVCCNKIIPPVLLSVLFLGYAMFCWVFFGCCSTQRWWFQSTCLQLPTGKWKHSKPDTVHHEFPCIALHGCVARWQNITLLFEGKQLETLSCDCLTVSKLACTFQGEQRDHVCAKSCVLRTVLCKAAMKDERSHQDLLMRLVLICWLLPVTVMAAQHRYLRFSILGLLQMTEVCTCQHLHGSAHHVWCNADSSCATPRTSHLSIFCWTEASKISHPPLQQ